jgi:hypothetical protein
MPLARKRMGRTWFKASTSKWLEKLSQPISHAEWYMPAIPAKQEV